MKSLIPSEDGVYEGIPDENYRSWPWHSKSSIWAEAHAILSPNTPASKPCKSRGIFGQAMHAGVLEGPESFKQRYAYHNEDFRRIGKAYENLKASYAGREPIKPSERVSMCAMRNAINGNKDAVAILDACSKRELSVLGHFRGTRLKGRIDGACDDFIFDLKTTSAPNEDVFNKTYSDFGYGLQAALYYTLMYQLKEFRGKFYFLVVTKPDKRYPESTCWLREVTKTEMHCGAKHLEDLISLMKLYGMFS